MKVGLASLRVHTFQNCRNLVKSKERFNADSIREAFGQKDICCLEVLFDLYELFWFCLLSIFVLLVCLTAYFKTFYTLRLMI